MFRSLRSLALLGALAAAGSFWSTDASAQVTTGSMRGSVTDPNGNPLEGARVKATHVPSGTVYSASTRADGRFVLPGMRVGGPYTVEASRIGFERQSASDLRVTLGVSTDLQFKMGAVALSLSAVTVTSTGGDISTTRTGAATTVPQQALEQMPSISRRIDDFTRLTPQAAGTSFAGADNRMNNITVDGAYFNNSFGLAGQPGDRTGVSPISLDAIEAVQVNIAPYDVRQGNFVGAMVNTVTKSGSNDFSGSLYYSWRNENNVGSRVGGRKFNRGVFDFGLLGARVGGAVIKNKLFFFASVEQESKTEPGTTFRANEGTEPIGGSVTRVLRSDLETLSDYLRTNFAYETGPFQDYSHEVPVTRLTTRVDYAINERSKISLRYTKLDSKTDVLLSNSNSLGFGNRRTSTLGLNFQNSNYQILENINSVVGEWNTLIGANMANNMIVGYTNNDESRDTRSGTAFPLVDILNASSVYTTFGLEPFTPANQLRYKSFQFQNNFSIFGDKHDLTFGASVERYESENVFFDGSQSVYVYNSLADFYTDANDYLANPARVTSPVTLNRFQVRWANIPGQVEPVQPLEVFYAGLYAQDEWRVRDNLTVSLGVRVETPKFGDTGFDNAQVDGYNFRDELGRTVKYSTGKLPDAKPLISPRLGVNWDVGGDGVTQIRGGTGIFTGRPAYVWISNQIGNNGVITGFENLTNITTRPFHPDPDHYKPAVVTGAPAASYTLALTDPNFKFPQVFRTNLAVDRKLPWGMIGTFEWLLGQDVNGMYYLDANLSPADGNFTGPDKRQRWSVDDCATVSGTQQRINCNITNAIVLKNSNRGNQWNIAASLERTFRRGLFAKAAYSYGESRNTVDPGSIAAGTWTGNAHPNDPNNPGVGYSGNTLGHRFFATLSYSAQLLPFGPTGLSVWLENRTAGNASYIYSADMNGDGATNDLLYIPKDISQMNFEAIPAAGGTRAFTIVEQQVAFENFIMQDRYLRNHRGSYVERGAVFMPRFTRMDVSFTQDVARTVAGKPNKVQFRLDIFNFTHLLNSDWGRSWSFTSTSPLIPRPATGAGLPVYRMRNIGNNLIRRSYTRNSGTNDVWRLQFGARYTFN